MTGKVWVITRYEYMDSSRVVMAFVAVAESHIQAFQECVEAAKEDSPKSILLMSSVERSDNTTDVYVKWNPEMETPKQPEYNIRPWLVEMSNV